METPETESDRELEALLNEVKYIERRRFAKVLHDDIAQEIMAAAMLAKVTCEQLKAENHPRKEDACLIVEIMERVTDNLKAVVKSLDTSKE